MTTIINLYGGPGSGKSTLAAGTYAQCKQHGQSVELVREYVKAWAWRGDAIRRWDELYIFAKQLREESNLYGKVDLIITDRPLGLSVVYERMYGAPGACMLRETYEHVRAMQHREGIRSVDLLVRRTKPYVTAGRFESEDDARRVDELCKAEFPGLIPVASVLDVLAARLAMTATVEA